MFIVFGMALLLVILLRFNNNFMVFNNINTKYIEITNTFIENQSIIILF